MRDTLAQIQRGELRAEELPVITVLPLVKADDDLEQLYVSLNNRRLWVLKQCEEQGLLGDAGGGSGHVRVRVGARAAHGDARYTVERCSERARFASSASRTTKGRGNGAGGAAAAVEATPPAPPVAAAAPTAAVVEAAKAGASESTPADATRAADAAGNSAAGTASSGHGDKYRIVGFAGCGYHERAVAAAARAGLVADVVQLPDRRAFQRYLKRGDVAQLLGAHHTSPAVFLLPTDLAADEKAVTFVGGCDDLLERLRADEDDDEDDEGDGDDEDEDEDGGGPVANAFAMLSQSDTEDSESESESDNG